MPIAAVAFDFEPFLRFDDTAVRLQTVALAVTILLALLVAARVVSRTPTDDTPRPRGRVSRLGIDDLVFVVLAIVPGAIVGGRLGYALIHLDYYGANPGALFDTSQGSLQLSLAVVGGVLSGAYAAWLLEQPVGRWLHAATLPVLLGLSVGKVAMAIGGEGQGSPSDLPWATSYLGPGPWGSLAPAVPSHPAQLYEAGGTAIVLLIVIALISDDWFAGRDGRGFLTALGLWALVRFAVAFTWRDPALVGPLRADQALSLAIVLGCLATAAGMGLVSRRAAALAEPAWPDPETRPHF